MFRGAAIGSLVLALVAQGEPLALVLLDTEAWDHAVPAGWRVKMTRGAPNISVVREAERSYVRLRSDRSSYGLERGVDLDPAEYPWLTWQWKVTELPRGGDFRKARTDDQAAQVLVAFEDRRVIAYIWDTTAPKGAMQSASSIPLVRIFAVVCRSGDEEANRWLTEARNLGEDYRAAYGRPAPRVKGIRLQINSQHTGTSAECLFGEVGFRKTPP